MVPVEKRKPVEIYLSHDLALRLGAEVPETVKMLKYAQAGPYIMIRDEMGAPLLWRDVTRESTDCQA